MFQKIIRALGFSVNDKEEEIQEISSESIDSAKEESSEEKKLDEATDKAIVSAELAPILSEMIYNEVIKDIRRSLEEVVKKSGSESLEHGMSQLNKISNEIDELRRQTSMFEKRYNENHESQLSSERQKRTYVARIENLEKQISQLEAENEQLRIENRGMANKLRVASVINNQTKKNEGNNPEVVSPDEKYHVLVQENESLVQENESIKAENNRLCDEKKELEKKIEELTTLLQSSTASDDIISEKNDELTSLTATYDEVKSKCETLEKELELRDHRISELEKTHAQTELQLSAYNQSKEESAARIIRLEKSLEEESEIRAQLEESLESAENRIEDLGRLLKGKDVRIQELDEIRKKRDVMLAQANASVNRMRSDSERKEKQAEEEIKSLQQKVAELEITQSSLEESRLNYIRLKDEADRYSDVEAQLKAEIDQLTQRAEEAESLYKAALAGLEEQITQPLSTKRKRGRPRKDSMMPQSPETNKNVSTDTGVVIAAEPQTRGYIDPDSVLDPDRNAPVREEATIASKRKVKPVISAIDELLDSADWLEAPAPVVRPPEKPKEDDDFGYKAPRKQNIDNDAQMSLW